LDEGSRDGDGLALAHAKFVSVWWTRRCLVKLPLQITFRDIEHSDDGIVRCHVVVSGPHRHHQHGRRFHVLVDMTVPGQELAVSRSPAENAKYEDMHASIEDAFDDAERVLEDYAKKLRREVKTRHGSSHGRVARIFATEGYGFIEAEDGRDIYFHKRSVLRGHFDRLAVGTLVRYAEEDGDKGPQASTVDVAGRA
jgi:cold shock CspA family protein